MLTFRPLQAIMYVELKEIEGKIEKEANVQMAPPEMGGVI